MSLLDRYREDSDFAADGNFTIDREKARLKLSRYQLARLEDFALLVVQALVAAQATSISIGIDKRAGRQGPEIQIRGEDVKLDSKRLDKLHEEIFSANRASEPYRLLAIACNAVEPFCQSVPRIVAEQTSVLFTLTLKDPLPKLEKAIKTRVLFCPCQVTLNSVALPQTDPDSQPLRPLKFPECFVKLVRFGVEIESKRFPATPAYSTILTHPDFVLDASCSHVVEDELYFECLARSQAEAERRLVELAADQPDEETLQLIFYWLPRIARSKNFYELARLPLFPRADSTEFSNLLSMHPWSKEHGSLAYSKTPVEVDIGRPVVLITSAEMEECLTHLFAPYGGLQDAAPLVARKIQALQRQQEWEKKARPTQLPPGNYLSQKQISGPGWQAEVGFQGAPGGPRVVDILYQNKLLCSETLPSHLPPGSQAVLNLDRATVNFDWTGLEGEEFEGAMKGLVDHLESFFHDMEALSPSQIYPCLRDYLLDCLSGTKRPIPTPALKSPLFELANEERFVSAEELSREESVCVAPRYTPVSPNFPQELFPHPCLVSSPETLAVLKSFLLPSRLNDRSDCLDLYRRIDEQLQNPQPPQLKRQPYLIKWSLESEDVRGELAVVDQPALGTSVTCYYHGVRICTTTFYLTQALGAMAEVDSTLWRPNRDWTAIEEDRGMLKTRKILRQQFREMEKKALSDRALEPERKIVILLAYPELQPSAWDIPLYLSRDRKKRFSLRELDDVLRNEGLILMDNNSGPDFGKPMLATPGRDGMSLLRLVFKDRLRIENAQRFLEIEARRRSYLSQEAQESLRLPGEYKLVREVAQREGLIGFQRVDEGETGQALCYVEGRFVISKSDLLPPGFTAVLSFTKEYLLNDYSDVILLPTEMDELEKQCFDLLAEALEDPDSRESTIEHLTTHKPWPTLPIERLKEVEFLQGHGGKLYSPRGVMDGSPSVIYYLSPDFDEEVVWDTLPLLRHEEEELKSLFELLQQKAHFLNVERRIRLINRDRAHLREIEQTPLPNPAQTQEFSHPTLRARLMPAKESVLVGRDLEGQVVGLCPWYGLPVWGEVWGLYPGGGGEHSLPFAELDQNAEELLEDWVHEVYLTWCRELVGKSLIREERMKALDILRSTARLIGSSTTCKLARIAQMLWTLPLFLRADSTFISGAALATEFVDNERPVLLAPDGRGKPPHTVVASDVSEEYKLLKDVFGLGSLQWYAIEKPAEAVESADMATVQEETNDRVARMSSWSFNPWRTMKNRLFGPLEFDESKEDPEKTLLRELHSDLTNLLQPGHFESAAPYFATLQFGSWPLGPVYYRSLSSGRYKLNRLHPGVRWLLSHSGDPKLLHRGRMLLLLHWVGDVNIVSQPFLDDYEDDFLVNLVTRLEQTLN